MNWRFLLEDWVSDSFGLAVDEAIALSVAEQKTPVSLRLYTYRSHCALVGRFQRIENELNLEFCAEQNISVNRRPTGGGAILMGNDQLGVAWMVREQGGNTSPRGLMSEFSGAIVEGLHSLGIEAKFRGKNDLEVNGRKIAGLGIHRNAAGGFLFHASLLVGLNVELMLRALNVPLEKMDDKTINKIEERITTVKKETGREYHVSEVRQILEHAFSAFFHVELKRGHYTDEEKKSISELETQKYLSPDWIFQKVAVPDMMGEARLKTLSGLLDVRVTMAGRQIKAVFLGGDFFAGDSAIADLEGCLRWHSSNAGQIRQTLEKTYSRHRDELEFLPLDSLCKVIFKAITTAKAANSESRSSRYGCFVNPDVCHERTPAA